MNILPFHDGRSFALFLRARAKQKGLSMYQVFEMGVIDESGYYKYLGNRREPRVSTAAAAIKKLSGVG